MGRLASSYSAARAGLLLAALCAVTPAIAQQELTAEEIDSLNVYLVTALAAPKELAYRQVLTDARLVRDTTDSTETYDVVVRYDPERYHTKYAGLYPLTFEDQFIQWGKRIALYTRSIAPSTKRYFLHDISSGQQAWMFTAEARHLHGPPPDKVPAAVIIKERKTQRPWLRLMHNAPTATALLDMSGWLRNLRRENRENVIAASPAPAAVPVTAP